ncbi:uncharacterized protein LOC143080505 isoform X3 [Mytilus galloprovincialis]|uniref:uncharacterized protein LOC143080505 isoform X3 n=1 Tax=Mytilus galloprovincialis TaxID=29158 RepID=UPI003F7C2877
MAVADDEKRSDVLEDANKIEVSFEPSEFGSSSPLTKVADPGSPGKNLNTCTVSLTTLEPGFPRRPVQSTSAGITHSCVGTQEYEHVVSKSRRSSVVAEHEHYRSAVKSLHSTFSITSDKNYLKSSPDDRCSDENVFNAAELPEDTLNETEILNDMADIGQDEEMRTEDDIKELEKNLTKNAPQEKGTLTSTGEDETEILNDMADIGQDEEMKTEDDIKGLEKYGTKNAPQEKGTSTRTGGDETEILNDMADIGQDEEMRTEDDIKELEKNLTKNAPQETGTLTSTGEDETEILNDMADIGQDEEMKTEDDIKGLEKYGTKNAPQEKGTSTRTGGDETEILNDMADIGQDEEMKTEDDIKGLEKYGTKNAPQEKGTSTRTGGDETEILNDMADIGQDEEMRTEDDIKELEKNLTKNAPQETGTLTSTGEDETEILNDMADIGQDEEMKTEDDIKGLEKYGTKNAPQEKRTSTRTGGDETEILNDLADIGQDEEMRTEDDIKGLEKYGTKNAPQEKGTSTRTGGDGQWIFCVVLAFMLVGNVCKCTEMSLERDKVDVYLVNENSIRVIVKTNDTNKTTKWMMTRDRKSDTLVFQNKVNPKFMGKVKWENDTSILINDLTYEDWNSYLSFIKGFDSSITKKLKEYVEPVCPYNLSVVDSLETNVTVMWYFGLSRGHQLVTYLQYKMNESSEWLLVANMSEQSNQKNKKIIIADLIAETLYNLRLFTVDMDYSGFVCKNLTTSTKTVKQEPQLKKPDNKPMMQSILEGICACLSVATIIGVLVLLIRLRKHLLYIVKKKAASNGQTNGLLAKYKTNGKKMVEVV